jgi:hypothetical protein
MHVVPSLVQVFNLAEHSYSVVNLISVHYSSLQPLVASQTQTPVEVIAPFASLITPSLLKLH